MIVDKHNYRDYINSHFEKLPFKIEFANGNTKLTDESFKKVFQCKEASYSKNIIYVWSAEKPLPRLKGESDIIYIGQTKRTLRARHAPSSGLKAYSQANSQKYNDIVNQYGPISISYIEAKKIEEFSDETLRKLEGQFLWWYFQNHSEYPPINYTKTKNRNTELEIFI